MDVGILFMSIPREIYVFENEFGTTQLSFEAPGVSDGLDRTITCKIDNIQYKGFTPQVGRQICVAGVGFRSNIMEQLSAQNIYSFLQSEYNKLSIISTRTETFYTMIHFMNFFAEGEELHGQHERNCFLCQKIRWTSCGCFFTT